MYTYVYRERSATTAPTHTTLHTPQLKLHLDTPHTSQHTIHSHHRQLLTTHSPHGTHHSTNSHHTPYTILPTSHTPHTHTPHPTDSTYTQLTVTASLKVTVIYVRSSPDLYTVPSINIRADSYRTNGMPRIQNKVELWTAVRYVSLW